MQALFISDRLFGWAIGIIALFIGLTRRGDQTAITCPIRFRQNWIIADDAASFFFPAGSKWTSLTEVRLNDKNAKSAGNIDVVLAAYDEFGRVTDFGALEVQPDRPTPYSVK